MRSTLTSIAKARHPEKFAATMPQSIRVRILKRDFSLMVREEDEALTRQLAEFVDERIQEFRRAHPDQPEVTAAVIAALSIAEELYTERDARERLENILDRRLGRLAASLEEALQEPAELNGGHGSVPHLD